MPIPSQSMACRLSKLLTFEALASQRNPETHNCVSFSSSTSNLSEAPRRHLKVDVSAGIKPRSP